MLPKTRIDHPNAWTTDSVRSKADITYKLSDAERSALDTALNAVKAQGLAVEDISASDFPLGVLEDVLAGWIQEVDHGKGLVLLHGFPIERYSKDDCVVIDKKDPIVDQRLPFNGVEIEYVFAEKRIYTT